METGGVKTSLELPKRERAAGSTVGAGVSGADAGLVPYQRNDGREPILVWSISFLVSWSGGALTGCRVECLASVAEECGQGSVLRMSDFGMLQLGLFARAWKNLMGDWDVVQ